MKALSIIFILSSIITGIAQRPVAKDNGKFFDENGRRMLYGGESAQEHL